MTRRALRRLRRRYRAACKRLGAGRLALRVWNRLRRAVMPPAVVKLYPPSK